MFSKKIDDNVLKADKNAFKACNDHFIIYFDVSIKIKMATVFFYCGIFYKGAIVNWNHVCLAPGRGCEFLHFS